MGVTLRKANYPRLVHVEKFDPSEMRDDHGQWSAGGAAGRVFRGGKAWANHLPLGSDGKYHLYHGTTSDRAAKIKQEGLKSPAGTGPGYLMLTTSKEQAARYGHSYESGHHSVVEYALTPEEAAKHLARPEEHNVYGHEGQAHGLLHGSLPADSIAAIHEADSIGKADFPTLVRKANYPTLVRAHVRGGTLPAGIADELARYFHSRPDARAMVAAKMGYDPLADPASYMAHELAAPEHSTLRATGKPLTLELMHEWESQEDAQTQVQKDQPAMSDVHVDTAMDGLSIAPATTRKRKPKKVEDADELEATILKADDEKRVVYGIVLEPDVEDSQGDIISKEDVELAAHRFLYTQARLGDQHRSLAPETVKPVESYIAPTDFELGGQVVKAGSWVLAAHVPDDALWQQVKKGEKTAWSVAGSGRRQPLVKETDPVVKEVPAASPPPAIVNVHFNADAFQMHHHMPEQPPAVVNVTTPEHVIHNHVEAAAPAEHPVEIHNHVETPEVHVNVEAPKPRSIRVEEKNGRKRYIPE